jgi:hypothetical protein
MYYSVPLSTTLDYYVLLCTTLFDLSELSSRGLTTNNGKQPSFGQHGEFKLMDTGVHQLPCDAKSWANFQDLQISKVQLPKSHQGEPIQG